MPGKHDPLSAGLDSESAQEEERGQGGGALLAEAYRARFDCQACADAVISADGVRCRCAARAGWHVVVCFSGTFDWVARIDLDDWAGGDGHE